MMKANPGGTITGDAIVGRKKEIAEIFDTLQTQSVLLTAERRVGKTSLLRKMSEVQPNGWIVLLCLLEGRRHPIECVKVIYDEAKQANIQSRRGKILSRVDQAGDIFSGLEVDAIKVPGLASSWKTKLDRLIRDIVENTDHKVIICLDEFPLHIWNIIEDHGAPLGMEFLDYLRELRQTYEPSGKIRFILSGSIGLHLVINVLRSEHSYRGAPTNDMKTTTVGEMSRENVDLLCTKLLNEENIEIEDREIFIDTMGKLTDGLPNYIQLVCQQFQKNHFARVTSKDIEKVIEYLLNEEISIDWFKLAVKRIDTYYGMRKDSAREILKFLCKSENPISEEKIISLVKSKLEIHSDHEIIDTLRDLREDHYLTRDYANGRCYHFKYYLLRHWWKRNIG